MSLKNWFERNMGEAPVPSQVRAPKPKLVVVNHAPSREEFRAWRDDPTTQFVFAALRAAQANQKAAWEELSWVGGEADELALIEFRTRADAYAGLEEADYEGFCEWANVETEPEETE